MKLGFFIREHRTPTYATSPEHIRRISKVPDGSNQLCETLTVRELRAGKPHRSEGMKAGTFGPDLKEVMTRRLITAAESESLLHAQKLMIRNNITRLVIVNRENNPAGILTHRDMVRALVENPAGTPLDQIPIGYAMTKHPIILDNSASLKDACRLMISKGIGSIIVVDDAGKAAGIATKTDVCRYLSGFSETNIEVRTYMSGKPVTIGPNHSIFTVANILSTSGFTRLVVVDEENRPVGIVTLSDIVSVSATLAPTSRLVSKSMVVKGSLITSRMLPILLVRNVMTYEPIVVNEWDDIADVAKLMIRHGISGLPVVNGQGKLTGIITKSDLVRVVSEIKWES